MLFRQQTIVIATALLLVSTQVCQARPYFGDFDVAAWLGIAASSSEDDAIRCLPDASKTPKKSTIKKFKCCLPSGETQGVFVIPLDTRYDTPTSEESCKLCDDKWGTVVHKDKCRSEELVKFDSNH